MKEKVLFWIMLFFILHVIEEYLTGFVYIDRIYLWLSQPFLQWASPLVIFTLFQIILWTSMILLYFYVKKERKIKMYYGLIGVIIIFETHHIIEAILIQKYYPGLVTATVIVIGGLLALAKRK